MIGVRRGREFTWGNDLRWLSWRWCWWLFSVALRWPWLWNLMTAAALPLCRDTDQCPLLPPVYPFYHFSSFSPTVSLGLPVDIPGFFGFYCFGCFSLSLSFSPCLLSFSLFFSPLSSALGGIYRGRGSGVDPTSSHRCVHTAHVAISATSPAMAANEGVVCEARLLRHLIMRWVAEHMGERKRQETKRRK